MSEIHAEQTIVRPRDTSRSPTLGTSRSLTRELPHDLIEAFKSTLEETTLADFLIQVIDASIVDASSVDGTSSIDDAGSDEIKNHMQSTSAVLREVGAGDKPVIQVFNKTDLVKNKEKLRMLSVLYPEGIFLSAKSGEGIDALLFRLEEMVKRNFNYMKIVLPLSRGDLISRVYRDGIVFSQEFDDSTVEIEADLPESARKSLSPFILT